MAKPHKLIDMRDSFDMLVFGLVTFVFVPYAISTAYKITRGKRLPKDEGHPNTFTQEPLMHWLRMLNDTQKLALHKLVLNTEPGVEFSDNDLVHLAAGIALLQAYTIESRKND